MGTVAAAPIPRARCARLLFSNMPPRLLAILLLTAPLPLSAQTQPAPLIPGAEIVFLDVGQGDAILIQSDTFNILIDAGHSGHIMQDLNDRGVHHIHLLIASHYHDDHIGDMDDVVRNRKVDAFIGNGCKESRDTYQHLQVALQHSNTPVLAAVAETRQYGRMSLQILPSLLNDCGGENNASIGVLVRLGRFSALLTGDSQTEEEDAWTGANAVVDVDVLKAAHHGADNGMDSLWLARANPEVIVISVGNNSYNHPGYEALRRYAAHGRRIYQTQLDGTVVVCVKEGGEYAIHAESGGPPAGCNRD
jgi:beta-lactamase superfamily II metal-dependent hydrolase